MIYKDDNFNNFICKANDEIKKLDHDADFLRTRAAAKALVSKFIAESSKENELLENLANFHYYLDTRIT